MKTDYKPLMQRADIPWHNPNRLTPEQVDTDNTGWRLLVDKELRDPPFDTEFYCNYAAEWRDRTELKGSACVTRKTYRTREPLPEKYRHLMEPDYTSKEHQRKVLLAAFDGIPCQFLAADGVNWITISDGIEEFAHYLNKSRPLRIKPVVKRVPLDDYRLSELLRKGGRIFVIEKLNSNDICSVKLSEIGGQGWRGDLGVIDFENFEIHRNGSWQPCYREVEVQE